MFLWYCLRFVIHCVFLIVKCPVLYFELLSKKICDKKFCYHQVYKNHLGAILCTANCTTLNLLENVCGTHLQSLKLKQIWCSTIKNQATCNYSMHVSNSRIFRKSHEKASLRKHTPHHAHLNFVFKKTLHFSTWAIKLFDSSTKLQLLSQHYKSVLLNDLAPILLTHF